MILRRLLSLYGLLFFVFVYAPILLVVIYSFNANTLNMMIWDGFTLDWYRQLFGMETSLTQSATFVDSTDQLWGAVRTSLIVALSTSVFSTVCGTALALAVARYRFRLARFYRTLMMLPMIMPDIVLGIALLIFFITIGMNLSMMTIIIGQSTFLISYVFVTVSARLAEVDTSVEEASADLGATPAQTFRKVTLPGIAPGILGGWLLAFIISMDDLVITYFIAGTGNTTLPIHIWGLLRRGIKPEINAIATLMLLFTLVIAAAGLYFRSRRQK
ncbi:ABC transporter permease [Alloyangia pacifica]|uniref:Spermidine/putrescine transport system permease protein n=1 Tax=Alloyangia pacifica TaxID=311180 RepID=A0A1I6VVR2_9RHOB|nr:ABC transporter permease [Alloyangia pacifica]SDI23697.1 spermidine/putrescine transport system permease protein [Alloyangia pacifica]SFT17779.1 spermidine/putrescine transport system permease protein [Alloyangia pacifica]